MSEELLPHDPRHGRSETELAWNVSCLLRRPVPYPRPPALSSAALVKPTLSAVSSPTNTRMAQVSVFLSWFSLPLSQECLFFVLSWSAGGTEKTGLLCLKFRGLTQTVGSSAEVTNSPGSPSDGNQLRTEKIARGVCVQKPRSLHGGSGNKICGKKLWFLRGRRDKGMKTISKG